MTFEDGLTDFPTPDLALEVQRGSTPGAPGGIDVFFCIVLYFDVWSSAFVAFSTNRIFKIAIV